MGTRRHFRRPQHAVRPYRRRPVGVLVACLILTIGATALAATARTNAAFDAVSSGNAVAWGSGTVAIVTDGAGSLFVGAQNLQPSSTATQCVRVRYTGTANADVRLFAAVSDASGAGWYLSFTIDLGTTGPSASRTCTTAPAFGGTVTSLASGVLADSLPTTYASGYANWTASPNDDRWYRITYVVDPLMPDEQYGRSVSVALHWQAQST